MRRPEFNEIVIGLVGAVLLAVVVYAGGVPSKLAVHESRITTIENRFDRFDSKLDRILESVRGN